MSFFSSSRDVTFNNSTLNNFKDQINITNVSRTTTRSDLEGGPAILTSEDVVPQCELRKGSGYRIYSAKSGGRVVIVKTFHGARAKRDWTATLAFSRRLMHPNLLHMIATSSPVSDSLFIVFDGAGRRKVERLFASALRDDLSRSVMLGLKMIFGLSSGLNYLTDQKVPLESIGIENFDILLGNDDDVIIGINPIHLNSDVGPVSHQPSVTLTNDDEDWLVLDALCRKIFNAINHVLYREQVIRENRSGILPQRYPLPALADTSQLMSQLPYVTPADKFKQSPRREFVWVSLERGGLSLEDISDQFGDFIETSNPAQSLSPLRRLQSRDPPRTPHRCPGYNREEITLTTNLSSSAIISHRTPTPREICVLCGEVVGESEDFRCICDEGDDYARPNIRCTQCSIWQHRDCVVIPRLGARHFLCNYCDEGDLEQGVTRCLCGKSEDDLSAGGFMMQCEACFTWQHGLCLGYEDESQVPDKYFCEQCRPELHTEVLKKLPN